MLLTLAILNLRFGFWLQNPAKMRSAGARYLRSSLSSVGSSLYVLLEICGLLDESRKSVFLTNGGEVENLGIYELLRRQCTVIIAVDAEADPEMAFGSFSTMLRYASIDLGIEINLPWQQISHSALRASYEIDRTGDVPKLKGPHCAIGQISYANGKKGILIYIKPSLTGDENDYIVDYKRRHPDFPHETTLDQFFKNDQFEVYRALGYHSTIGVFDGQDSFSHLDETEFAGTRELISLIDQLFPIRADGELANSHFIDRLRV